MAGNRPPNTRRCNKCGGTGRITVGAGNTKCDVCNGTGQAPN
jgi:DnaJ-class molecular chaperone